MSLPTVKWLFSIMDYMSTFAPSHSRQGIHVGTLLALLPSKHGCLGINHCESHCDNIYSPT